MAERILVTGAAGFAGRHLVACLLERTPAPLLVGWRRPGSAAQATAEPPGNGSGRIAWQEIDVLDPAAVERAIAALRPDQVYHLAGAARVAGSWNSRVATLRTNVAGTEHVLEALRRSSPRARILIPGSALVYRPRDAAIEETDPVGPNTPYGLSKLAQEMLGARYAADGLDVVLTRSFTHIGPGQDTAFAASSFACQIARIEAGLEEPTLRVGNLDARRDLLDVRDTVRGYRALMASGVSGAIYNVCSGQAHRMADMLAGLLDQARVSIDVRVDPARLRPSDHPLLLGNRARITTDAGWKPGISLRATLRDLLDHWRAVVA